MKRTLRCDHRLSSPVSRSVSGRSVSGRSVSEPPEMGLRGLGNAIDSGGGDCDERLRRAGETCYGDVLLRDSCRTGSRCQHAANTPQTRRQHTADGFGTLTHLARAREVARSHDESVRTRTHYWQPRLPCRNLRPERSLAANRRSQLASDRHFRQTRSVGNVSQRWLATTHSRQRTGGTASWLAALLRMGGGRSVRSNLWVGAGRSVQTCRLPSCRCFLSRM